jgi:hypothetical protein
MDEMLTWWREDRVCVVCQKVTTFHPVDGDEWVCTACDAALTIPGSGREAGPLTELRADLRSESRRVSVPAA